MLVDRVNQSLAVRHCAYRKDQKCEYESGVPIAGHAQANNKCSISPSYYAFKLNPLDAKRVDSVVTINRWHFPLFNPRVCADLNIHIYHTKNYPTHHRNKFIVCHSKSFASPPRSYPP